MKLSEAMMLGSVTVKMEPMNIQSCALGAAGNAVGIPNGTDIIWGGKFYPWRLLFILDAWPWLRGECVCGQRCMVAGNCIAERFNSKVCWGKMTFEQLVDWVASVEPSCGECNRFECSCVKSEAVPVTEEVTA